VHKGEKMDKKIDKNDFAAKASRMLVLLMVLMGLCLWPAASITSSMSNPVNNPVNNTLAEKPSNCSWTGNWNTYFGNMTLKQSGNIVVGAYEADGGRINGTVSGNKLVGTWSDAPSYTPPAQAGDIEFNLSADCNSFSGRWRYGSEGNWSTNWSGTRVLPA
jgi:hypothetical protein